MMISVVLIGWLTACATLCAQVRTEGGGLEPENVLVVYNEASVDSTAIARYYRSTRKLPANRLCPVKVNRYALAIPPEEYQELRRSILAYIESKKLKNHIRCLLLMSDLPQNVHLRRPRGAAYLCLDSMLSDLHDAANPTKKANLYAKLCRRRALFFPVRFTSKVRTSCGGMMLVSRIEAPGLLAMKRMLDSARLGEQSAHAGKPFVGTFYIDTHPKKSASWELYNRSMLMCAEMGKMLGNPAVIERTEKRMETFDAGPAVFYTGWYTLSSKINRGQNRWAPGAIAIEIHSGSARLLKSSMKDKPTRNSYVAFFATQGVAGTYGAVREPYLDAYPKSHEVLTSLRAGLTWAESFWANVPHHNWQMLLLGDPLYRPFPQQ